MEYGVSLIRAAALFAAAALALHSPAHAAEKTRITGLSDVNFGMIVGLGDQSISQSVCAYTSSKTDRYSISAVGSGAGGAFTLTSSASVLVYDVLWADAPNMQIGTALVPNVPATGFTSESKQQTCNSGPPTTASLTIVLRDQVLSDARAGSYSGQLQLTIAPE